MRYKLIKAVAVVLTAIFICSAIGVSAAPSYEKVNKDYRNMEILNRQSVRINKPTAQFCANRVVNGAVADVAISYPDYDCNTEFPTLTCYVGDTLTFTDMSKDNNGGSIIEWDWQYYGALGRHNNIYQNNIVNTSSFALTEPGETIFYLCVRGSEKVKRGCCDLWSENGNHQTVGKNKWFPTGAYWYFTAVRVIVKPIREAVVHVRYWNAQENKIFHEGYVNAGMIYNDADTVDTSVHLTDWEGYEYSGWNVQLPDGTIQYSGNERDVEITLAGWVPEKYLNVEFYPYKDTSVEVRYWDKAENVLISSETLTGEKVIRDKETTITANIKTPEGYKTDGWNVQLTDGTIQYEGNESPTDIVLSGYVPKKYLNVKCYPLNNKKITVNYINSETSQVIRTRTLHPCEGDETSITAEIEFENIPGYVIEDWILKTPEERVEKTGTEDPVFVTLTDENPHKILDVNCFPLEGDEEGELPIEPTVIVKPSGVCDGIITWTETDSHRVFAGYTSSGKRRYRTCSHTFKYRAVLNANATISPDTFKSGYGFEVNVACTLNTSLISNSGGCTGWGNSRSPGSTVKAPTKATVYIPWDMTNRLGTQGRAIAMEQNGKLRFILPVSKVSEAGARKIYTPVELPGTEEEPVTHEFEIYINGGGVKNVEFCQKLIGRITINGDMYSDDFSGAD